MKTYISRQTLQIAITATCFVMLFAPMLSAKAKTKAKSEPNTVSIEPNKPAKAVANEPNTPPASTRSAEASVEPGADSVAVTVNGVDIKESQVETQLAPQLRKIAAQLPPAFVEQYKKQLRQQVLEGMIVEQLLDKKVKENNIVVTDANVVEYLEKTAAQQNLKLSDIKEMMESRGQNFDEVKQRMKKGMTYQKLMDAQWAGKISTKEEDVKKYYSENKAKFEMPEQVKASHILITPDTSDPNADPNKTKAAAEAKAQGLLKKIKGGADFAELAKANSDCPSAKQGGDLGFGEKGDPNSNKRGTWVEPFEKAAFALKPGQVSDVVETPFGYHIIKVTEHKDANTISFEEAKDDITKMLTQDKQAEFAEGYIASLKADAKIVYPPGKEPPTPTPPAAVTPAPRPDSKPVPEPEKKDSVEKKTSDKKKAPDKKKTSAK